eukprot:540766_1
MTNIRHTRLLRYLFGGTLSISGFGTCYWADKTHSKAGNELDAWNKYGKRPQKDTEFLVTAGPYSYSRNPMCLGIIAGVMGCPFIMPHSGIYFLIELTFATVAMSGVFAYYHFYQIPNEEIFLQEKHGQKYIQYKKSV